MKRFALFTILAALSGAAQATPETYVIDSNRTASLFSFSYLGVSNQTHKFDRISGKIVFDPVAKTGAVDVTIDATSVNTGHALFDAKIQAADFFDTANYPAITFRSSKMTFNGDQVSLSGELTIKGVTRPVTLAVTYLQCLTHPTLQADACDANATFTVKRSDFNMGKYGFLVSNEIKLSLAIKAVKEQAFLQLASRDGLK